MNIKNKSAIITFADTDLGKDLAIKFSESGARVALIGKDEEKLKELQKNLNEKGGWAIFITGDLCEEYDTDHIAAETIYQFGKIDFLVNINSPYSAKKPLWETETEEFLTTAQKYIKERYLITKKVLEDMVKFKEGNIINISTDDNVFTHAMDNATAFDAYNYPDINVFFNDPDENLNADSIFEEIIKIF